MHLLDDPGWIQTFGTIISTHAEIHSFKWANKFLLLIWIATKQKFWCIIEKIWIYYKFRKLDIFSISVLEQINFCYSISTTVLYQVQLNFKSLNYTSDNMSILCGLPSFDYRGCKLINIRLNGSLNEVLLDSSNENFSRLFALQNTIYSRSPWVNLFIPLNF